MKPKVYGNPVILFDPFQITKTIALISLICCKTLAQDISLAEMDLLNKEINLLKELATLRVQEIENQAQAEARWSREEAERNDIVLNKAEIKNGKYWINGGWHYKNLPRKPTRVEDLIDSDNDGFDDYTEYKYGTDWNNAKQFPIIRNGNNKRTF